MHKMEIKKNESSSRIKYTTNSVAPLFHPILLFSNVWLENPLLAEMLLDDANAQWARFLKNVNKIQNFVSKRLMFVSNSGIYQNSIIRIWRERIWLQKLNLALFSKFLRSQRFIFLKIHLKRWYKTGKLKLWGLRNFEKRAKFNFCNQILLKS